MHILTKVFVLFAAVLSVLMAALAISYTANAGRIVADYHEAQATATAAKAAQAAQEAVFNRELESKNQSIESLRQRTAELESTIRELDGRYAEEKVKAETARADADAMTSRISQLGVAIETQSRIIDSYRDELQDLRVSELRWRGDKLDLEDELADRESQIIVFEQTIRSLREEIAGLNRQLAGGGATRGDTTRRPGEPTEIAGPAIRGQVQEVKLDVSTGATLVQVSLGQSDRVNVNNKLYLVRDGRRYLGEMVIENADVNWSVGRIVTLSSSDVQVRPGDQVVSRLGN